MTPRRRTLTVRWSGADRLGLTVLLAAWACWLAWGLWSRPAPQAVDAELTETVRERIDPNTAPAESLRRLPGIGPALAGGIIAHREAATRAGEARAFRTVDDLIRVPRIGPVTLERLRPLVAVAPAAAADSAPAPPGR